MTKAKKKLDLRSIDPSVACDKGYEFELLHPHTEEPVGTFITVLGKDSKAWRDHTRAKSNARMREDFEGKRKGKTKPPTVEEIEEGAAELLAKVTVGWRDVELDGEELPFNEANAKRLYTELPWVRHQVDEAASDLGNFMKD